MNLVLWSVDRVQRVSWSTARNDSAPSDSPSDTTNREMLEMRLTIARLW